MNADFYQEQTRLTAIYPGQDTFVGLLYCALGLAGEAGEIANKVKKILRDEEGIVNDDNIADLVKELGDLHWYAARFADEIGIATTDVMRQNLAKLAARAERNALKGSGDDR